MRDGAVTLGVRRVVAFGAPLALLAAVVTLVGASGLLRSLRGGFPPVEELTIERARLEPGMVVLEVVNGGPEPATIAQVMVDDAYWTHEVEPSRTLRRLARAAVRLPYPWVEGDAHVVKLVTSTGLVFEREIAVATLTPRPTAAFFARFALVGVLVGVVPIVIGFLWGPFLRSIARRWTHFALALTIGLLVFLGADAVEEALETARGVAGAYQGTALVLIGSVAAVLLLQAAGGSGARKGGPAGRLAVATLIALGIGLHNLGEGLAIGAAYAVGEVALGAFLVIGFLLHNTTEGVGIIAPVAADRPGLRTLAALAALAGGPTIAGAWMGGLAYSPFLATLFLAIGAGAIAQVIWAVYGLLRSELGPAAFSPLNVGGAVAGLLVMYATGLLVAA